MGETNREGHGTTGRRPDRPTPAPGSAVLTPPTGLPAVGAPAPSVPAQRTPSEPATPDAPPPAVPAPPDTSVRMCTCGHPEDMHDHYRAGDDCGACGSQVCAAFRDRDEPVGPLWRIFRGSRG